MTFLNSSGYVCAVVSNSLDYSQPDSSVPGVLQARILEWVAMPSSRGSSPPQDQTHVSCMSRVGKQIV